MPATSSSSANAPSTTESQRNRRKKENKKKKKKSPVAKIDDDMVFLDEELVIQEMELVMQEMDPEFSFVVRPKEQSLRAGVSATVPSRPHRSSNPDLGR